MLRATPYAAVVRIVAHWQAFRADIEGRARLAGVDLRALDFPAALDVVYALMVDEVQSDRHQSRMRLNEVLEVPLDPDDAEEWHRDRWGMTGAALQEQSRQEDWLDEFTVG